MTQETRQELAALCHEASKVAISPVLGSLFARAGDALTAAEAEVARLREALAKETPP